MSRSVTPSQGKPPVFRRDGRPILIGHRGGSLEVPENTMAAFRHSRDLGLDWFELDVRLASDGPVVCHDEHLRRVAQGNPMTVGHSSLSELRSVNVGSPVPSDYAQTQLRELGLPIPNFGDAFPEERIPTLGEALSLADQIGIMVEMKAGDYGTALADETVASIRASGVEERVLVGSFDVDLIDRVSELASELSLIGIVESGDMIHEMLRRPISVLAVSAELVELANRLRSPNVALWVWTVRDLGQAAALTEQGVDGMITDIPKKTRDLIHPR